MVFGLFKRKETELPWIVEGKKIWGLHETRDNAALKAWLRSDGKTLGDPKALPWCGDYVETAIKNSLPNEQFVGEHAKNAYWARNWLQFGAPTTPVYGAVGIFARDGGGHVGFLVGEDATDYYVLGGNQSNAVNITRIAKNRFLGARWPISYKNPNKRLPIMSPDNIPRTTNEF